MASSTPSPRLTHFALFVENLEKMRDFYTGVLALTVTDQGPYPDPDIPIHMVFMSNDPTEHHQFVLITGRPDDVSFALNQQMSFLVRDLDELRAVRGKAADSGTDEFNVRTHGNARGPLLPMPDVAYLPQTRCQSDTRWRSTTGEPWRKGGYRPRKTALSPASALKRYRRTSRQAACRLHCRRR